ncbi:MAG: hypothetical protein ACF8TS_18100, partial [Maioricimonas sp. JB049]
MSDQSFTIRMPRAVAVLTAAVSLLASGKQAAGAKHTRRAKKPPAEGRYVETDQGFMVPYSVTIPGTELSFRMVPIPGGTYLMGSPEDEEGHQEVEGPQIAV